CLGIGGKGDGKASTLVSESVGLVIDEAVRSGVKRIVCMSNVGAGGSGPWLYRRIVLPIFLSWLRPIIADKDRMEELLRSSGLEWVSVRLPNIVDGPGRPIRASASGAGLSLSITAASVAEFLVGQVSSSEWVGQTPSISN
ncbi:MAG: NAD(P)H-binding protein, partial [Candidatus Limnocylindrus sp.]